MLDFRLRVFYTVAKLLNFTKAATALHITQPAVTKHIKELELSYNASLFDRQPNALALTEAGKILYKHATIIMEQYEQLDFDIDALNNKVAGILRIGANATIGQYVLPPILASFNRRLPDVNFHLINENSSNIQQLLSDKAIDIGFTEGKTSNSDIQFIPYLKDEIVLVCGQKNNRLKKNTIDINELYKLPFIIQEGNTNTNQSIEEQIKGTGIAIERLQAQMHFDSVESIKLFLGHSDHFAFMSIQAIIRELSYNKLKIIDISNIKINKLFHIAIRMEQPVPIVAAFLKFIKASTDNG